MFVEEDFLIFVAKRAEEYNDEVVNGHTAETSETDREKHFDLTLAHAFVRF